MAEAVNTSPTEGNNKPKNSSSGAQDNSSKQNTDDSTLNSFPLWNIYAEENEFNRNINVYFGNKSTDYFIGHINKKIYPKMQIMCKDNKTEILINFDITYISQLK